MHSAIKDPHVDAANTRPPEPLADGGEGVTPDERLRALTLLLAILFAFSALFWGP